MRVQDLMRRPAIACHVHDALSVPAKLMWDHDCGVIPVVRDDGELAGMITDREICMAAYTQGRPLHQILVNSVMARHVIPANPDPKPGDIERSMAEHQVRRVPVGDEDERPVGVLPLGDLAIESVEPDTQMTDASRPSPTSCRPCPDRASRSGSRRSAARAPRQAADARPARPRRRSSAHPS